MRKIMKYAKLSPLMTMKTTDSHNTTNQTPLRVSVPWTANDHSKVCFSTMDSASSHFRPHCYWNLILELPETGEFQSSRVSLRIVLPWKTAQRDARNKPGMMPSCPSNKPGLMSDRSALWESQGREVRVLILPSRSMINKHPPGVNSDLSAKRWWHL